VPDPTNPADLPASWLPEANPGTEKPAAYRRAVARKIKNDRHAKVLAMSNIVEDWCRSSEIGPDTASPVLTRMGGPWWRAVARFSGHPCRKVSPETMTAVIDKVRADLAAPYRAKGRG
jgi:hypothetical protein